MRPNPTQSSTNLVPSVDHSRLTLTRLAVSSELYRVAANSPIPNPSNHLLRARAIWEKVSIGRRKAATVAAAALALGVGYHVIFGANGITVYEQKRRQTLVLNQQMQELQHQNELLKGHVDRLQNDPEAIEHQAREELHLTRPGEIIYTLPGK